MHYSTSNSAYGGSYNQPLNRSYQSSLRNRQQVQDVRKLGLTNLGNTCYMNSVFQSIFDVLEFDPNTLSQQTPVTVMYSRLQNTHSNSDYVQMKKQLQKKLEIVYGNQQQDALEFLLGVLEVLNRQNQLSKESKPNIKIDYSKSPNNNWGKFCDEMRKVDNSKVIDIFGGEFCTQSMCANGHIEYLFQRFLSISIPIRDSHSIYHVKRLLINNFVEETVDGVECDKCGTKTVKRKKSAIYRPPKVLVINLKRFQQGFVTSKKINARVAFDQTLQLPQECIHPDTATLGVVFELYAIIHHYGTLNGGHYYIQKKVDGVWMLYNDHEVTLTRISPKDNVSDTAYMFFYRQI